MSNEYNGWTNYETWCVNIWLTNDEFSQREIEELATEAWEQSEAKRSLSKEEDAIIILSKSLKEKVEEGNPLEASLYSDLLSMAIASVQWGELAKNFLDDVDKE